MYDEPMGSGDAPPPDREPPGWAEHQRFKKKVTDAISRGDAPGVPLQDAILMLDARITSDPR
jgi:hypothetical protein